MCLVLSNLSLTKLISKKTPLLWISNKPMTNCLHFFTVTKHGFIFLKYFGCIFISSITSKLALVYLLAMLCDLYVEEHSFVLIILIYYSTSVNYRILVFFSYLLLEYYFEILRIRRYIGREDPYSTPFSFLLRVFYLYKKILIYS